MNKKYFTEEERRLARKEKYRRNYLKTHPNAKSYGLTEAEIIAHRKESRRKYYLKTKTERDRQKQIKRFQGKIKTANILRNPEVLSVPVLRTLPEPTPTTYWFTQPIYQRN